MLSIQCSIFFYGQPTKMFEIANNTIPILGFVLFGSLSCLRYWNYANESDFHDYLFRHYLLPIPRFITTKVSQTQSQKIRQRAIENLTRKKLKGYSVWRSNRRKYWVQILDFLKICLSYLNKPPPASILLKQTPTTACCKIYFFKYFRKASSKIIIDNGPNTRAWILSKRGYSLITFWFY